MAVEGETGSLRRVKRRRAHAEQRRERRVVVKLNDVEYERLAAMAEVQGLSIPRLMTRATFSGGTNAAMRLQLVLDEVRGLIRLMGRQGVLLNQLTAATHSTGQAPAELAPTLRSMQQAIERTKALADGMEEAQ